MNGFSLLMVFASLGVVYSWRTGADQQQEYVLQIEPEIVQALASGEEIFSDVPANVGPLARLCITVLAKDGTATKHTAAGEEQFRQLLISAGRYASLDRTPVTGDASTTILWPGRLGASPEQTYGVTTGWQPDKAGHQQYIVQIDPTVLSTLALGDELYVPIDPAAGRMVRFVVKAGREQLPRVGGTKNPLAQTPGTQPQTRPNTGRTRNWGLSDSGTTNWNQTPPTDPTRQPSRYNIGVNETPATDGRGSQYPAQPGGTSVPGQGIGLSPPQQTYGNGAYGNQTYGNQTYGNAVGNPPATYPNYTTSPTSSTNNFDQYRGPLSPPDANTGRMPVPHMEAGSTPGYPLNPVASQLPGGQRQFNPQYPETRVAALPHAPLGTANPGGTLTTVQPLPDKPWGPLLFVTFALFFSIGGNLYLAYTALEFHSRYRNAIERLRSAARSA